MAGNLTSAEVVAGNAILDTWGNQMRDDILNNAGDAALTTGSANAYLLALDATITAYAQFQVFKFNASFANTGPVTLNVNGIGAKSIKKNHDVALESGDIESGQIVTVMYDGTNLQLVSPTAIELTSANKAILQGGVASVADTLHTHSLLALDEALIATNVMHIPIWLGPDGVGNLVYTTSNFNGCKYAYYLASIYTDTGTSTANRFSLRSDGTGTYATGAPNDGILEDESSGILLDSSWTSFNRFRLITLPAGSDTYFLGFTSNPDALDATSNNPANTDYYAGFGYDGTNWFVGNANAAGVETKTTIATPSADFHTLKIQRTASSIIYSIDGAVVATHTTNLPSGQPLGFYYTINNNTGTSAKVELYRAMDIYLDI